MAGVVLRACRVGCRPVAASAIEDRQGISRRRATCTTRCRSSFGRSAEIRYVSSGQPVTFGFRRPVVLLPEMLRIAVRARSARRALSRALSRAPARLGLGGAEEVVKAVLWFHPAVLWLISRVRLAREEVVDELTVLATSQRRAYMEALLVFADAPSQAPAAAFARRRHLFRRMVLISKEAVMSSRRILVFECRDDGGDRRAGAWFAVSAFPLTRDGAGTGTSAQARRVTVLLAASLAASERGSARAAGEADHAGEPDSAPDVLGGAAESPATATRSRGRLGAGRHRSAGPRR